MDGYLYFIVFTLTEDEETIRLADVAVQHIFENAVEDVLDVIRSDGSHVGTAPITPFSSIRYRLDANPFDAYKIDAKIATNVVESASQSPSHVAIEVGNDLRPIYYRFDAHSFDQYLIDHMFEPHDKENTNALIADLFKGFNGTYGVELSDSIEIASVVVEDAPVETQEEPQVQGFSMTFDETSSDQWTLDQPLYDDE
jgi:hypothetical protein